jgi:hypothetical protein
LQLFLDRPSPKGKDKGHNYTGYRNERKQTEGPIVTGFGEYTAEDDRFDDKNGKPDGYKKERDDQDEDRADNRQQLVRGNVRTAHFTSLSVFSCSSRNQRIFTSGE